MRNAIILHGIYGNPEENWIPWMRKQLEARGVAVSVPYLPTHEPLLPEHWWNALAAYEDHINEETIVIAHSLGVAFALKIIERQPVRAAFFVAPALGKIGNALDPMMHAIADQEFDWNTIRKHCPHFTIFHSDNDPYLKPERAQTLAANLQTDVTVIPNAGHFNEAAGYTKFDQLLREIEKILESA